MATNNDRTEWKDEERDVTKAESMTVARLRNELKRRKLKTMGNKADLVERFLAALVLEDQKADDEDVDGNDDESNRKDDGESDSSDGSEEDEHPPGSHEDTRKFMQRSFFVGQRSCL